MVGIGLDVGLRLASSEPANRCAHKKKTTQIHTSKTKAKDYTTLRVETNKRIQD